MYLSLNPYHNRNSISTTSLTLTLTPSKADLAMLRAFEAREDLPSYKRVLKNVLRLFGEGIHESLTRTMAAYLEVTGGRLSNENKSEWEKDIAAHMIGANNPAESPFATVRAFLHMYPRCVCSTFTIASNKTFSRTPTLYASRSLKLRTVATLSLAIVNGTHRPAHKAVKRMVGAGLALTTSAPALKAAVSALCCVRRRSPGNAHPDPSTLRTPYPKSALTLYPSTKTYTKGRFTQFVRENNILDEVDAAVVRKKRKTAELNEKARAHANKMNAVDVALTTTLAETATDVDEEITSFSSAIPRVR